MDYYVLKTKIAVLEDYLYGASDINILFKIARLYAQLLLKYYKKKLKRKIYKDIKRYYRFINKKEVIDFISDYIEIIPRLKKAHKEIKKYFRERDEIVRLHLEYFYDDESDYDYLVIQIEFLNNNDSKDIAKKYVDFLKNTAEKSLFIYFSIQLY